MTTAREIAEQIAKATALDTAGEERALADAIESAFQAQQWELIETAPKDGREISVCYRHAGQWVRRIAYWDGSRSVGRWLCRPCAWHIEPTHWQPLPIPPRSARAEAERIVEETKLYPSFRYVDPTTHELLQAAIEAALLAERRRAIEEAAMVAEQCRDAWERDKRTFPPAGAANMVALHIRALSPSSPRGDRDG